MNEPQAAAIEGRACFGLGRPPGRSVPVSAGGGNGHAFIPGELPLRMSHGDLEPDLLRSIITAEAALADAAASMRHMPNRALLVGKLLQREAVISSEIEGTQTSYRDLVIAEAASDEEQGEDREARDRREVRNFHRALRFAMSPEQNLPPCLRLMREMHKILMTGAVRGHDRSPGEFRRIQNWIGPEESSINDAIYVPPPPNELPRLLANLESNLQSPSSAVSPVIDLAVIHYQFEAIHPFCDGNGRLGRALITILLKHWRVARGLVLFMSGTFRSSQATYYAALAGVSQANDWGSWVRYFANAVEIEALHTTIRASDLRMIHARYVAELQQMKGVPAGYNAAIDIAFDRVAVTVKDVHAHMVSCGVDRKERTARRMVDAMVEAGILMKTDAKRSGERSEIYLAAEVAECMSAPIDSRKRLAEMVAADSD